ncbi:AbrB/MazE/SpoVT family DNA-binding domain-containing protein [Xanthobacter autotrophicus]|uniref:AbrB/MazE/SpoVT family DNA-binding domain-containing protein n=1 Tax=Xanthobacter autotrophicus TaxID=280 RepID=UPI0024A6D022|nr:AbrB/MazE/SpoVT family DNA-binding domain-containing protein [Xanthobacter autotrophicus]MDI4658797.1 AbrB/MazE/SpoVT family DNA-binding domain-containing protein [Xanthobacter autotrophicus]
MNIAVDARITAKGQVTLPVEVRRVLGVGDGDQVEFFVHRDGRVLVHARKTPTSRLFGRLKGRAARKTDAEAIAEAVAQRDAASMDAGE